MMLGKGYIDVLIVDRPQGGKAYTPAEFQLLQHGWG